MRGGEQQLALRECRHRRAPSLPKEAAGATAARVHARSARGSVEAGVAAVVGVGLKQLDELLGAAAHERRGAA